MTLNTEPPRAGSWKVVTDRTRVEMKVRHFAEAVTASFADVAGEVEIRHGALGSTVSGRVGVASFASGSRERDEHVRGPLLNALSHPDISLTGTVRGANPDGSFLLDGVLRVRDLERPVELRLGFLGWQSTGDDVRAWFYAEGVIDRRDFRVGWNRMIELSKVVGNDVRIELRVELVQAS